MKVIFQHCTINQEALDRLQECPEIKKIVELSPLTHMVEIDCKYFKDAIIKIDEIYGPDEVYPHRYRESTNKDDFVVKNNDIAKRLF